MRVLVPLLLAATPLHALSCIRPDVVRAFEEAQAATESYVILKGQITLTDPITPPDGAAVKSSEGQALMSGHLLTPDGFTAPVEVEIDVTLTCLGHWCGQIESGAEYLLFASQSERGLSHEIGPCFGQTFENPSSEDIARLEACAAGGPCA